MSKYTAEDFANAEFAELPKYGIRAHKSAGNSFWQRDGITRTTNEEMADAGWVPVPDRVPERTITQGEYEDALEGKSWDYGIGYFEAISNLGITVIPDPEPTNAEKLEAALRTLDRGALGYSLNKLARDLDKAGVKAPTDE